MTFKNINSKAVEAELSKLISLGYDLYKDNLQHFDNECNMFPRLYITDDLPYATCRIKDGIVFGLRGFSSHSNSNVFTHLGLSVGNICNNKLNLNYSIVFSVNSNNNRISISMLQKNKDTEYQPDLITTSKWDKLTETEQLNLFIKSMTILGFNEQDVKNIINGSMKAIDAYMNIAPEDKKNKRWCIYGRHYFEFDGNTLIYGNCSIINNVDEFPFPFKGNIIIDCNRANTSMINIKNNKSRKIKLININKKENSIKGSNLTNIVIDEIIDLSKVDATSTIFGHHTVINLDTSIANVNQMDLKLACDINGNRYNSNNNLKMINKKKKLKILSNVDNTDMAIEAINNNGDGLGLIRTETLLYNSNKIINYIPLLFDPYSIDENIIQEFKKDQKELLDNIYKTVTNGDITIRLFDFNLTEIIKFINIDINSLKQKYNCDNRFLKRGATFLVYYNNIVLRAQIESILEISHTYNKPIKILIPYVSDIEEIYYILNLINNINKNYNVKYQLGAMIENMQSIDNTCEIAKIVDFIAIGLNDLTESIIGKSRYSHDSSFYYINDTIKKIINEIIFQSRSVKDNIDICICGEHTNYIENIPILNSLDINSISVHPIHITRIKKLLNKYKKNKTKIMKH